MRGTGSCRPGSWGSAPGRVGLLHGPSLGPIGPSAFDVAANGDVTVLDELNRRIVRWHAGRGDAWLK